MPPCASYSLKRREYKMQHRAVNLLNLARFIVRSVRRAAMYLHTDDGESFLLAICMVRFCNRHCCYSQD